MNGTDVRRSREALGWSRAQLAERTGFTVAQHGRIELKGPRDDEVPKLTEVLKAALEGVVVTGTEGRGDPTSTPAQPDDEDAEVVLEEWRGLTHGTVVKLAGDTNVRARYTFLRYRRTPGQEYVELKAKNGNLRTVRPDRVRTLKGQVPT